jgi:capsular polysaccharide biosynthesis protein
LGVVLPLVVDRLHALLPGEDPGRQQLRIPIARLAAGGGGGLSSDEVLERLKTACHEFEQGRHLDVIQSFSELEGRGGDLAEALRLASEGLLLEQAGRPDDAVPLMEQALAMAAPQPALVLELVRFFSRTGRHEQAHHTFLMHQTASPGTLDDWTRTLPQHEIGRYTPWAMRSSGWARRRPPDVYALGQFKAALTRRLGPEGAAIVLSGMEWEQGAHVAALRPLERLIDHAREHGEDYRVSALGGATRSTGLPIFGQARSGPSETLTRTLFSAAIHDVVVPARSGLLFSNGRAILDVQNNEVERAEVDLAFDPLIVAAGVGELLILEPCDEVVERMPEAIWLTGMHSEVYGHWLLEFLPRLWALMGRPGFHDVPILVDHGMPPQHMEAVRFFAGERNPVRVLREHESVRVARLWVASAMAFLPPSSFVPFNLVWPENGFSADYARVLQALQTRLRLVDGEAGPRRVYLSRKPSQHRRLVNAPEIESVLREHGFVSYDLGELSFREQLRIIRSAEDVVAARGSAMFSTMFAPPGLRIAVMTPPALMADQEWMAQSSIQLGHELSILVGKTVRENAMYAYLSDYEIDPALLREYLATLP